MHVITLLKFLAIGVEDILNMEVLDDGLHFERS